MSSSYRVAATFNRMVRRRMLEGLRCSSTAWAHLKRVRNTLTIELEDEKKEGQDDDNGDETSALLGACQRCRF